MPYAFIAAFVFAFGVASYSVAHDPKGHAAHHEHFYMHLKQPGTNVSCCNNQDCRPVPHRVTTTGVEFFVGSKWIVPPASTMIETNESAESHWCGVFEHSPTPVTYCAIVPRGGV